MARGFGLAQLLMQAPDMAPTQPHSSDPLANLTPEQLAEMFQPFDDKEAALQRQLAQAEALRRPRSGHHTTAGGAALGGFGDVLRQVSGDLQTAKLQPQFDALAQQKAQAGAHKFGLMQALERQKADKAETLKRDQMTAAAKAKADAAAAAKAEWDRQNGVTSKQALQRAHVMAGIQSKARDDADGRAVKKEERKEDAKKQAQVVEIEEKSRNINAELDKLDKLVDSVGTFEIGGTATPEMEAAIDTIAIDMSKLRDPGSVVRSEEKEGEKKALFSPGVKGLFTSNKTAKELIGKYRQRVEQRRGEAYKVRGLTPPTTPKTATEQDGGLTADEQAEFNALKAELGEE